MSPEYEAAMEIREALHLVADRIWELTEAVKSMRDARGGASTEASASERGDSNMVTATTSGPEATSPQGTE